MKIYITVKSLAKRKNFLSKLEWKFRQAPTTLRELISEIVKENRKQYEEKRSQEFFLQYLTAEEIQQQGDVGKVSFGERYNEEQTIPEKAVETAIQAFEDGLFKVFINEEEVADINSQVTLHEGDEVVFIKLTMLAGRMW
ncbi:hypothetical protein [Bacillus alkalicellulosilyticus]|uniref:hypothetical protein n=1 Tax=Alkalihalobacterium alkalicellulosilyticum TaxID=1912214 RepID=UPI0009963BC3|nr:hypothetical protein [Bacillus alkalicellulosilyticus]